MAPDARGVSLRESFLHLQRKKVGAWGERVARRMIESQGLAIVRANWRATGGEIDVIAVHRRTLIAIEVKTRQLESKTTYPALSAVNEDKRARLRRVLQSFVRNNGPLCRRLAVKADRVDAIEIYYTKTWFGFLRVVETAWHTGLVGRRA